MSWISRIANAFRPARTAADLDEELQFHIEQRLANLRRAGLSREDAERAARLQFGNRLSLREASQEMKSAVWLESLARDFRFGLRMLAKYRMGSWAAIASLALAIGACTATFSLIDALMLRRLPVRDPKQLFDIARVFPPFMSPNNQPREFDVFSYPQFELLRESVRASADLFMVDWSGGFSSAVFDGSGGGAENVRAEIISGGGFCVLGIKPAIGRLIQADNDSPDHMVAVISYPFWKRRFGGSASVLGRTVSIQSKTFQIIGVTAPSFDGLHPGYLTDLWVPIRAAADAGACAGYRTRHHLGTPASGCHPAGTARAIVSRLQQRSWRAAARQPAAQSARRSTQAVRGATARCARRLARQGTRQPFPRAVPQAV